MAEEVFNGSRSGAGRVRRRLCNSRLFPSSSSPPHQTQNLIGIKASPEYPSEPLHIDLIESKGLDGERQKQLITSGQHNACELSSCLMLVALCEVEF
ncbi:hypothetical protein D5086_025649 [Populus alba]|uniref:Uncharacterized protein n=1 Tax=Populus alba TaxID=43335 RepID=A0ACC4AZS1_POPAL